MTPLLYACAVVITLETQTCRKYAPRFVEFNFFTNRNRRNWFRRTKEEGQIYKTLPQIFNFCLGTKLYDLSKLVLQLSTVQTMYRLPTSFPTRLKQTHETVDCWKFSGEHAHLQSNNETFFGQRQLNTFSLSAKCDGVCQKCVCAWGKSSCQPLIPGSRWDDDPVCDARRWQSGR